MYHCVYWYSLILPLHMFHSQWPLWRTYASSVLGSRAYHATSKYLFSARLSYWTPCSWRSVSCSLRPLQLLPCPFSLLVCAGLRCYPRRFVRCRCSASTVQLLWWSGVFLFAGDSTWKLVYLRGELEELTWVCLHPVHIHCRCRLARQTHYWSRFHLWIRTHFPLPWLLDSFLWPSRFLPSALPSHAYLQVQWI